MSVVPMKVIRHELKNPQMGLILRDSFYARMAKGFPMLATNPSELLSLGREILAKMGASVANGLPVKEVYKDLTIATNLGERHFLQAARLPVPDKLDLGDIKPIIGAQPISRFLELDYWLPFLRAAYLVRSSKCLRSLIDSAHSLWGTDFQKAGSILTELEANFHASLILEKGSDAQNFLEDIFRLQQGSSDPHWLFLGAPEYQVWRCVLAKDPREMNLALKEALESHKTFWSTDDKRSRDAGWISLPLLHACAYAHDHGMEIEVESDYIPRWLYLGEGIK
ncbi:MAG: immunity 49 family protein [Bacteroidia bacterium]|nr:immunity 49 family protein [Bacteroidia bacterium]